MTWLKDENEGGGKREERERHTHICDWDAEIYTHIHSAVGGGKKKAKGGKEKSSTKSHVVFDGLQAKQRRAQQCTHFEQSI